MAELIPPKGGAMSALLKPRWKRLICRVIDHNPVPATRQDWDDTHGLIEVTDADRTVCTICGVCPEDIQITRREVVLAGLGSLIGPEIHDGSTVWGDRRIHRPGRFGVREDWNDLPTEDRNGR